MACRRAARLSQSRAEARINECAGASRAGLCLQASHEHAAVPPEGRIGRHPGIKQLGALRHGVERKESAERVAHEDVPQGFSFKAFGNFGLHGLLKAFHEFRGAPALSGLSGVSTIAADARARGRQEGGAVGHVDGRNGTGRCGALRARKQAADTGNRRAQPCAVGHVKDCDGPSVLPGMRTGRERHRADGLRSLRDAAHC